MKEPPEHLHKKMIAQIDVAVERRDELLGKLVKAELKLKEMRRTAVRLKKRVNADRKALRAARAADQPGC